MPRLIHYSVGLLVLACAPSMSSEPSERCEDDAPDARFAPQSLLVYRVQGGDSLSTIAAKFRLSKGVSLLSSINHLRDIDQIRADSGLLLPTNAPWTDGLPSYQPETIVSPERRACESKEWSPVESKKLPAFAQKACHAKVADCSEGQGQQVCFCEGPDEDTPGSFVWFDQAHIKSHWPATISTFYNKQGGTRVFSVRQIDLDQDALDEVVVFAFEAGSNGVPIDTSLAAILSEGHSSPLLFTDDGTLENLFVLGAKGCEVQTSVWMDYTPQMEPTGLYQKREAYAYRDGAFSPSQSFPAIFQRYNGHLWKSWPSNPELAGRLSSKSGVIQSITTAPDKAARYQTTLTLRFSTGETTDFVYHSGLWGGENDNDWKSAISHIEENGMVYPYEYWPADLSRWEGRAVELAVHSYDGEFRHVLSLNP